MYQTIKDRLRDALARHIQLTYHVDLGVVLERPPKIEMGEAASPVCFELAKRLKKAPRILAQEIANDFRKVEGVARLEVAGAGYLNAYFDRGEFWKEVASGGAGAEKAAGLRPKRPALQGGSEGASGEALSEREDHCRTYEY